MACGMTNQVAASDMEVLCATVRSGLYHRVRQKLRGRGPSSTHLVSAHYDDSAITRISVVPCRAPHRFIIRDSSRWSFTGCVFRAQPWTYAEPERPSDLPPPPPPSRIDPGIQREPEILPDTPSVVPAPNVDPGMSINPESALPGAGGKPAPPRSEEPTQGQR